MRKKRTILTSNGTRARILLRMHGHVGDTPNGEETPQYVRSTAQSLVDLSFPALCMYFLKSTGYS